MGLIMQHGRKFRLMPDIGRSAILVKSWVLENKSTILFAFN